MELLIEENISLIIVCLLLLNIYFFYEILELKRYAAEDGKYIVRLEEKLLKIESNVFSEYYEGGIKKENDYY